MKRLALRAGCYDPNSSRYVARAQATTVNTIDTAKASEVTSSARQIGEQTLTSEDAVPYIGDMFRRQRPGSRKHDANIIALYLQDGSAR